MTCMIGVCDNQSLDDSCKTKTVGQDPNYTMRIVNEIVDQGFATFGGNI